MRRRLSRAVRVCVASVVVAAVWMPQSARAQALPSGWASRDIGSVGVAGAARASGSTFSVDGAGADIWGDADAFRFVYRTLNGDGSVTAQVASLERVADWTKAGVMMRDTLSADSRHASMLVSPGKGLAFQRRKQTGGVSYNTAAAAARAPYYVRVTRKGDSFDSYTSPNGVTWTHVGTTTIPMADTIYVGVVVSSHDSRSLATGTFASIAITGTTSGGGTVTPTSPQAPQAPPPPPPAPTTSSSSATTLKVLTWNVHHGGIGTDGVYDPARVARTILKMQPDIISLNEIDDTSQASAIVSEMKSQSGRAWSSYYDDRGNLVITRLSVTGKSTCLVNSGAGRKAAHMSTLVNGRALNFWSAHLDVNSSSARTSETQALHGCEENWAEARIVAGDFNMQEGSTEYNSMLSGHVDAWRAADKLGTASNYSGNCDGCTRNSRIDYVFFSKNASMLTLKSAQVIDTRDSNGKMPSDHKPLLVTYSVK